MFLLRKDFCIRCCSRCQQQKGAAKLQAAAAAGEGCDGHTAQPGDILAKVTLPSCPHSSTSSAGMHKAIPRADPAGVKGSLAAAVRSSYVSAAVPGGGQLGKALDVPEQWLELDVTGRTALYPLPKRRKGPTDNQLYCEMAKAC